MKRALTSCLVVLMAFIAISTVDVHTSASRKTAGRLDSEILWSYNKNTNTMTISPVKSSKDKKLNISKKDYKYWFQRSKKHIYKKGVSRLATPCLFDRYYKYNDKIEYGNITNVKISKDIKIVPTMSYSCEKGLNKIDISYAEYVGEDAFMGLSLIENVKNGYKLFKCKRIDISCFRDSIKLKKGEKLYLQKGLEYIGAYAFCGCSFEYVDIPDTVKTIGKGALSENKRLKKVKLPKGLERIEEDMFYCDKNLETVDIPDSVVQIGWCAFADSGIKNITIPSNVRILGNYDHGYGTDYGIFSNCKALKKVTIESSKIEKVYPGTFVKTPKNVVFVVPTGMAEEYKRTFVEAGLSKNNQFIEKDMKTVDLPIKLSSSSITVKEGFNRRISILNLTGDEGIEWTSDNEEIADVTGSANAKICAKSSGNATIIASVNGEKYICKVKVTATDLNDDANELKKLIKKQIKYGATVSTDILNSKEYNWKDGRLIKINWVRKSVYGNIDLNPFTCLESFIIKGKAAIDQYDLHDPMYNYAWSIDANDCSNLKKIVCCEGVLRELHMENANALEEINIKFNRVRTLDLTNLANLKKVNVLYNSELEKIILKGNYSLSTLICEDGNEDDVDNTPNIEELDLTDTNISELDVLDSVRIIK